MKKKPQILIIHGGLTFKSQRDYFNSLKKIKVSTAEKIRWTDAYLKQKLGKNFEIIKPSMPLKENAKYTDWKIVFEKYLPYLRHNIILIGCSLGGIFLAKYLSEHKFPKKIMATYLIAPPFDNTLPGEDLVGGFKLKANLSLLEKNSPNLYLLFSQDDQSVPLTQAGKYKRKLKNAKFIIFPSKNGHFKIAEFPEIIQMIKNNYAEKF